MHWHFEQLALQKLAQPAPFPRPERFSSTLWSGGAERSGDPAFASCTPQQSRTPNSSPNPNRSSVLPLPKGEGWDEGDRSPHQPGAQPQRDNRTRQASMTSAKVLLVEDDPGIRDTLQRVLASEGHEVVVEKRGDDGLSRASQTHFNVVITDLRLPGLNGLELVQQLHAARPRLPIILITAYGTTKTAIEATKLGAYDYVLKPFDIPQMLALVTKAADSNRLISEPVSLGESGTARDALVGQSPAMQ